MEEVSSIRKVTSREGTRTKCTPCGHIHVLHINISDVKCMNVTTMAKIAKCRASLRSTKKTSWSAYFSHFIYKVFLFPSCTWKGCLNFDFLLGTQRPWMNTTRRYRTIVSSCERHPTSGLTGHRSVRWLEHVPGD